MSWTCKEIEEVMKYMRVVLGATKICMFYFDNDRISYETKDGKYHQRDFSKIYKEMLDEQKKV